MNDDTVFRYNYSAEQNREVLAIQSKYLPKDESKMDELKRLDRYVKNAGMVQSLSIGILGCLLFGLGVCLAMQTVGGSFAFGVFLSIIGVMVMIFAYPVYLAIFKKTKEKYRPRILELAAELCGEKNEN